MDRPARDALVTRSLTSNLPIFWTVSVTLDTRESMAQRVRPAVLENIKTQLALGFAQIVHGVNILIQKGESNACLVLHMQRVMSILIM